MEYLESLLKLAKDYPNALPLLVLIAQGILWREVRAWRRELLSVKIRLMLLINIHCDKWTEDMKTLLVDPEIKKLEELEKQLNK